MPPRKSTHSSTPFADIATDQTVARPKRGKRDYRLFKDGSLNDTPIEPEIAIAKKNAQQSPLLCLPPEIRLRIWSFSFSGCVKNFGPAAQPDESREPFCLLRVCRQIYAEAASLPRELVTAKFDWIADFLDAAKEGKLGFAKHVRLRTYLDCLKFNFDGLVPRYVFEAFESIDITIISRRTMSPRTRIEIERQLRGRLYGKDVDVHHDIRHQL